MISAKTIVVLRLDHDFNAGRNPGGFHEVVLPDFIARNVHPGDLVDISDSELTVRGRVRCLVAVVEELPPRKEPVP